MNALRLLILIVAAVLGACGHGDQEDENRPYEDTFAAMGRSYFGTLEPFASEAVYFVLTDRFVDGDSSNNQVGQGGSDLHTFDRSLVENGEIVANIGYLGGDFRGIVDNADYIADMGFTAIWITPIVENPDEAFTGGHRPGEAMFGDKGKTGYHGYWGVNFFDVDEHLESPGLDFAAFVRTLEERHGIKIVLDVVANHGSPSWSMPVDQPMYGEIYDADGTLVADHENLRPEALDPDNPLHAFYRQQPDLAELGDTNWENPAVLDYFVGAYSRRLDEGVAAFRIDTIRHMPHTFWKSFADRIRTQRPGFFMFGESFNYEAAGIAPHTWPENGGISVLDFPLKQAMDEVFAGDAPYSRLSEALHLDDGIYQNPYELMSFYDNHDMPRMATDNAGFIDAHNWLFTARGIPVVYYGSESGFRSGRAEHKGNRDYFGEENVALARNHPVHAALTRIANIRRESIALQRGLQVDLDYTDDTAAFFRVFQHDGRNETVLVLLNGSDSERSIAVPRMSAAGTWRDVDGPSIDVRSTSDAQSFEVPPHAARILVHDGPVSDPVIGGRLDALAASGTSRQ